jgi:hypothetical protein
MREGIGVLKESSLHASLKKWYFEPGDSLESKVDGSIVDLVRGEMCIEFQTKHLYAIKKKVLKLLNAHPVRIVYPLALEKYIVRIDMNTDAVLSRRKSPKRSSLFDIFNELVRITQLISYDYFSFEVLLIREEQVLVNDGAGSWRRKGWSVGDRRLIEVIESSLFTGLDDYKQLIPKGLKEPFSVLDLAKAIHRPRYLASKMAYSLREMNAIEIVGKKGNAYLYKMRA